VSQSVSGEIVLEKLIETLLRTAIEHAGAERGLMIMPRGAELRIQAEAITAGSSVNIGLTDKAITSADLPARVVQYAARAQEASHCKARHLDCGALPREQSGGERVYSKNVLMSFRNQQRANSPSTRCHSFGLANSAFVISSFLACRLP
jgi:hypothetical protein